MSTRRLFLLSTALCALIAIAAGCGNGGGGREAPGGGDAAIEWTDVPDNVFVVDEAAAFQLSGDAAQADARVPIAASGLASSDAAEARVYRVAGDGLVRVDARAEGHHLVLNLEPRERYILYPRFRDDLILTHDLLCRLRPIREELMWRDRLVLDRICTRILCPANDFDAVDIVDDFPVLNDFPRDLPRERLVDRRVQPIGTVPEVAAGGICDRCFGFRPTGREQPLIPECRPRPSRPKPMGFAIINIVPSANSAETNQDSEPNVAVNPADTQQVAASAFTPNPAGVGNAPIFVSEDGGQTWAMNVIVQSQLQTGDITLRFTNSTNTLYAGILRRPGGLRMSIQSTDDFTDSALMTVQMDRFPNAAGSGPDQPYVQATDVGGQDRVYVGHNDLLQFPGRTASVEQTVDDAANWDTRRIETRDTDGQDMPAVRPAIAPGNVIYVAFVGSRDTGAEVVVVRDDSGATGANPYQDLTDADGNAGVRVVTGRTVPFENFQHANFGQERLVASDLSIAADPNDASRVCVAWGDRQGTDVITLHLRCSTDSGQTWDGSDRRTLANTKNPALAFSGNGTLGFLHQAITGTGADARWITRIERLDGSFALIDSTVLATTPANAPAPQFIPYIGDYLHLMALGNTFYGIFSANNTPDLANFPQGVTYQREADFNAQTLADLNGNPVAVSIDPFFFTATEP